jgi:hypothetical protein
MAVAPRATHAVKGMGKVYDWRGTGLLPPVLGSGGQPIAIPVNALTHHIPVIANAAGASDFITLANVLKTSPQGRLSLQFADDREGNVAIYAEPHHLCFQARGLNQQGPGVEHMHLTIGERWTERQYRAAAWIAWWLHRHYKLPYRNAQLAPAGAGLAAVRRRGHTTHRRVSDVAGFHDRVDPGSGFHRPHVFDLARFYDEHRSFAHAPTLGH